MNDLIVPTADPRLPLSPQKHSGFGTTRGAEGLLEMTRVKTISVRGVARLTCDLMLIVPARCCWLTFRQTMAEDWRGD